MIHIKKEMTRQQNDLQKKFQEQEETVKELALKLEVSIKREDEFREKRWYTFINMDER